MKADVSIILDTRREKKDNTYPVKLRVYSPVLQKSKLYSVGMDFTEKHFESVWQTEKPRKIHKEDRDFLDTIRVNAIKAVKESSPFSFETFEKKLHRRKGDGKNIIYHYNQRIQNLKELKRFGTAETYELSLRSLKQFLVRNELTEDSKKEAIKKIKNIPFNKITPGFLQKYENWMYEKDKSETTVSIYVRALRAIFNNAIRENEISEDIYPFGKNKYEIPAGNAVKKALSKPQLKILFNATPTTPEQEKAKDFWLFSFVCNGMNINDIALLKYKNIKGNTIEYKRAKTRQTAKKKSTTIIVYLTELSKQIIEKYGNEDKSPDNFIFSIINKATKPEDIKPRIKNFTRFVNQHIKLLAKANELPEDISSYYARHTFATLSIQGGASIEFVKEAFGHQNITTTQNYFAGFEDETKKQIVESLLNFD